MLSWQLTFADGSAVSSADAVPGGPSPWWGAVERGRSTAPASLAVRQGGRELLRVACDAAAHYHSVVAAYGGPDSTVTVFAWRAGGVWARLFVGPGGETGFDGGRPPAAFVAGVADPDTF